MKSNLQINKKGLGVLKRPVIAFALLKMSSEMMHSDLLAGVTVLIKPLVADLSGSVFDSKVLADRVERSYGLPISAAVLEDFVPRLVAAGVLEGRNGQGEVSSVIYCPVDADDVSDSETNEFQSVLDDFLQHARESEPAKAFNYKDDELLSAFLSHLATLDFSAIRQRPIVPAVSTTTISGPDTKQQRQLSEELAPAAGMDVLIASYLSKLATLQPERLDLLAKVSDGALGLELVLDLQAPQQVPRLGSMNVVFDSPLALDLLDCSSREAHSAAQELFKQITLAGAKPAIFQHSIEEAEGVISAVIAASQSLNGAYGPSVHRWSESVYRAYFTSLKGRVARMLSDIGIAIIPKTASHFNVNFSEVNEESLAGALRTSMLQRVQQREKDALSVAETMRLLGGKRFPNTQAHYCSYVFMTNNEVVRRRSMSFLSQNGFIDKDGFCPVVSDRYVAGLCWIINGGTSANSPSTARLLANCARALKLRPELASRAKSFLAHLSDEKAMHFEALMTNERASQYLMERTFGNPEYITQHNAEHIFEELRRRAVEDVAKAKDEFYQPQIDELKRAATQTQEQMDALSENLREAMSDSASKNGELEASKLEIEKLEAASKAQRAEVMQQSVQISGMQTRLATLDKQVADNETRRKAQIVTIADKAKQFASNAVRFVRAIGIVIALSLTLGLNYFDKMVLPTLPEGLQPAGNWVVIGSQGVALLLGLSLFTDYIWGRSLDALRTKIYRRRLASKLAEIGEHDSSMTSHHLEHGLK